MKYTKLALALFTTCLFSGTTFGMQKGVQNMASKKIPFCFKYAPFVNHVYDVIKYPGSIVGFCSTIECINQFNLATDPHGLHKLYSYNPITPTPWILTLTLMGTHIGRNMINKRAQKFAFSHLQTQCPSQKITHSFLDLFPIDSEIGRLYQRHGLGSGLASRWPFRRLPQTICRKSDKALFDYIVLDRGPADLNRQASKIGRLLERYYGKQPSSYSQETLFPHAEQTKTQFRDQLLRPYRNNPITHFKK